MKTRKAWVIAGTLALGAGASPLFAQEAKPPADENAAEATQGSPPLAGFSTEEIGAFFTLLSASAELDEVIAPIIDSLLEPGETVPDWQKSGIDIRAEIGAREGGLAGNLLHDLDGEVPSVTDLSGAAAPSLPGFTSLRVRAAPPGGANEKSFATFAPGIWLATESQHTRRGNAFCYKGLNGISIYSREPLTTWDEETTYLTAVMVATFDRIAAREFCVTYHREGDGFAARSFLPDGRRLPQMDAEGTLSRIMPAAELSAFIRDTVPAVPSE